MEQKKTLEKLRLYVKNIKSVKNGGKMMKNAIITPTYLGHFKFIKKYLQSCREYIEDKENITIIFTISKNEATKFRKITNQFEKELNIKTVYFDDILKKYNINIPENTLLKKYQKFSYQTLKKFYTMLYVEYDRFLVLDSESMFIRKTNIKKLFDNYFESPFITISDVREQIYTNNFKEGVIYNIDSILKINKPIWFLENFIWFYDKKILINLFDEYGEPIDIVERIRIKTKERFLEPGCFEISLYQGFIFKNSNRFRYRVLDANKLLKESLGEQSYKDYIDSLLKKYDGAFGLLEMSMMLLTSNNIISIANMYKKLSFNIIRCDSSNFHIYKLQQAFLEIVQPSILAASQGHPWGINDTLRYKIKTLAIYGNIYVRYIYFDLRYIMQPIIYIKNSLKSAFYIFKHTVKWCFEIIKNIKIFTK